MKRTIRYIILITGLLLLCITNTTAKDFTREQSLPYEAYNSGDFQKAIELFEKVQEDYADPAVYHNLGNAYYRVGNIPKAVLNYEKAAKLSPSSNEIRHSLEIARSKTIDRMPPESEMFFFKWYRSLTSLNTIDGWAYSAIVSLVLSLILFLLYLFVEKITIRRISFYLSVIFLFSFIFSNLFAWQRSNALQTHDTAIVMTQNVTVKSSPTSKSPDACVIHEGTWLRITDKEMKGWYGIQLSDGHEGWIQTKDVEEI